MDKKGSKICHFSPCLVYKNVGGGRLLVKKVQNYVQMVFECPLTYSAKIDLDKKWLPKQKTIQNFNIDALGFGKTRNENPPTREIGVTS